MAELVWYRYCPLCICTQWVVIHCTYVLSLKWLYRFRFQKKKYQHEIIKYYQQTFYTPTLSSVWIADGGCKWANLAGTWATVDRGATIEAWRGEGWWCSKTIDLAPDTGHDTVTHHFTPPGGQPPPVGPGLSTWATGQLLPDRPPSCARLDATRWRTI